jgi:hypothetical protein
MLLLRLGVKGYLLDEILLFDRGCTALARKGGLLVLILAEVKNAPTVEWIIIFGFEEITAKSELA